MKSALFILAPLLARASTIATTCEDISIDESSGLVYAFCEDTSSGETYYSELDLTKCLAWDKSTKDLVAEANGNFTTECTSCAVATDLLTCDCSSGNVTAVSTFDLTTLITNVDGCANCLTTTSSLCIEDEDFNVGSGSTSTGSSGSANTTLTGSGSGTSDVSFSAKKRSAT